MPLHRIQVSSISSTDIGFISDILFELGALSVSVEDGSRGTADEVPIFDEPSLSRTLLKKSHSLWQKAEITALYPIRCDIERIIMLLATHFNFPESPKLSMQNDLFDEKDPETWVRQMQESFVPIVVDRIRISFPWHDIDPSFLNIRLEPGCAFGTGDHPTTKLCLAWLQITVKPNATVLDFGTGSGVLAIASVLLKKGVQAVGVDIDLNAVDSAKSNAERNGVKDSVLFCENHEEPKEREYDVVVANILAEPLKCLAPKLVRQMKSGAFIGLAGILSSQAVAVMESYQREGVSFREAEVDNQWVLLIGQKF